MNGFVFVCRKEETILMRPFTSKSFPMIGTVAVVLNSYGCKLLEDIIKLDGSPLNSTYHALLLLLCLILFEFFDLSLGYG